MKLVACTFIAAVVGAHALALVNAEETTLFRVLTTVGLFAAITLAVATLT